MNWHREAQTKATFATRLAATLAVGEMVQDDLWPTLEADELKDWYELCQEDYLERYASAFVRLGKAGIDAPGLWKETALAALAPFMALAAENELGIFLLACPLNDEEGYDGWWEAIDETLQGFLEGAMCGGEEHGKVLKLWKEQLSSSELWERFVRDCLEFETADWQGHDVAPMKALFSMLGHRLLASELEG